MDRTASEATGALLTFPQTSPYERLDRQPLRQPGERRSSENDRRSFVTTIGTALATGLSPGMRTPPLPDCGGVTLVQWAMRDLNPRPRACEAGHGR
jgi:hypothetical protein